MIVALSKDFLLAFSHVQKSQQKKVREFIERFQAHPESTGLHYEPIQSASDKNVYSVRIDEAYRAIVAKPDPNLYVLLWVDHHDEAYRRAERTPLKVHPATGALQVVEIGAVTEELTGSTRAVPAQAGSLFAQVKDKHLVQLGVPEELLPAARALHTDADLEGAEALFPQEAYEALFMLASGYTLDEVFRELEKSQDGQTSVDTSDFQTALENEDSQRRFYVVEGAQELAEILAAPLEQWRIFLHPTQCKLVRMRASGPVRVLGGAGTGKTVTAMHRARYLAEEVFTGPEDRLLLTTFTKNLATDISQNLRKLCTDERAWSRIEVRHLDGWVANFLATQGFKSEVVYDDENDCWRAAMELAPADARLPASFYRVEWENVVQAQNITKLDEYLVAPRIGRGTRLSREMKRKVWAVFQEYRAELNQARKKEYVDLIRDARQVLEHKALKLPYRAVTVDEPQDMSAEAFRLIRALVPPGENDIFIVGDAHQRIYRHRVTLGQCGIDIRGRGKKVNYRTTDEIRRFAVRLLEGRPIDDLDGGQDDQQGYMSLTHGEPPAVHTLSSVADEIDYVKHYIASLQRDGAALESICVVARTKRLLELYGGNLRAAGFEVYEIKRDSAEQRDRAGLRLAIMHRVKGLEFDHVIVVAANKGIVPLDAALASADDQITERHLETAERALLYVATTRAKKSALITASGEVSPYLQGVGEARVLFDK
jgi:superfamily I DNA/RNA helicase